MDNGDDDPLIACRTWKGHVVVCGLGGVGDDLSGVPPRRSDLGSLMRGEVDPVQRIERLSIGNRRRAGRNGGDSEHPCGNEAGQQAHGGMLSLW